MTPEDLFATRSPTVPELALVWTAIVDVAPREDLGECPEGHRYMVPILGGRFFAGPGFDGLSGAVLPGGADRQLVDRHGLKTLDALYEMRTDDGAVLTIHNCVKIDERDTSDVLRLSVIAVTAPVGRFDWLNRRLFAGTLEPARPDREAVIIRGWGQR